MPPELTQSPAPPVSGPPGTGSSSRPSRRYARGPNYKWGVLGVGVGAQGMFSIAFQGIPTSAPVFCPSVRGVGSNHRSYDAL
jgi:hypothetical protein